MVTFHWNEDKERGLVEIVNATKGRKRPKKEGGSARELKWDQVAREFNARFFVDADSDTVRNRYNRMKRQEKQTKLLENSSGVGTQLSTMDETVLGEFKEAHPLVKIDGYIKTNNEHPEMDAASILMEAVDEEFGGYNGQATKTEKLLMDNKGEFKSVKVHQIQDKKHAETSPKSKFPMTPYEAEVISFLKKETQQIDSAKTEYQCSIDILNSMNLEESFYYLAVDLLSENNNAMKFCSIPSDKREGFLLSKLKANK